jgi:hypothetical protein
MTTNAPLRIPVKLLILDGFGAMLVGLGLTRVVAKMDLLQLDGVFPQYGFVLIGLGISCIAPLPLYLVKRALAANRQNNEPPPKQKSSVIIE